MDELCPNGVCRMMDKFEKPLYTDTDHFTDYANIEYIYPDFLDFLIDRNLI